MKVRTLIKSLLLLCMLTTGLGSAQAQYVKWKQVQGPTTLQTGDVVVIVDLATSNAMRNNPEYEEGNTVSKAAPPVLEVTLKEEQDRITSEVADTIVWKVDYESEKYSFKSLYDENNSKTRYLFDSNQELRVGFVSDDDASKRKFDLDKELLHRKIQTDETTYKDYHVGINVVTGIQAMMGGSTWELKQATDAGDVNSDIAATQMAFFKKVETSLPDPTLAFPKHDYEADVKSASDFASASPVATVNAGAGTITYYSGNENLATVDPNTGAVTVKKRGTVRIYAQVAATESYDDYLTSYVLRIDDTTSDVKGCRTNPFTVAEAIAYAKEEHADEAADGVCYFVKGIVSSVEETDDSMAGMMEMISSMSGSSESSSFDMSTIMSMFLGEQVPGTVSYGISDNGAAHDELPIKYGRGLELADMTEDDISVGDEVTVYGPLEYSEDNDMMSSFGGGNKEKTVKMPRINYLQEHKRNLITADIILYYGQTKQTSDLFSITNMFEGKLVTNTEPNPNNTTEQAETLTKTTIKPSDTDIAYWVVNSENTDSLLTPKKAGIITVTVTAPVVLADGDTIYMKRKFTLDVRDRRLLPAGTMVGNYELVTDVSQLKNDDKVLIVATIDDKPKVLNRKAGSSGNSDNSNPMASMFGGSSNATAITIDSDGRITEVPDDALIMTLEQDGEKWRLQTGRTTDYEMTYLYISDSDGNSGSMIPGMGSSGANLNTKTYAEISDSCQVTFTIPEGKNDSIQIQFNFQDRQKDNETVVAKNVIRFEKGTMSSSFGGFEPDSEKATLPRLYRLVQDDEYPVKVSTALWVAIISSYDVTLPEGLTGYAVKRIDETNNQAVLYDITDKGGLKAGVPYLLNATTAGTYTLSKADSEIEEPDVNLLKISDGTTTSGVYVLANKTGKGVGFYKWAGGLLGAGRVYLEKTASGTAPTYIPFAFGNDDTTGITTMDNGQLTNDDVIYDLQGRRVDGATLPKGLYIVNGKKMVLK